MGYSRLNEVKKKFSVAASILWDLIKVPDI